MLHTPPQTPSALTNCSKSLAVGSLVLPTYFELSLGTRGDGIFLLPLKVGVVRSLGCGQEIWVEVKPSKSSCALVFLFFFVVGNRFTILCWPLPYISMNQPQVHTRPLPPEPLSPLPPHPTSRGGHRALGWAPCVTQQIPTGCIFYIW